MELFKRVFRESQRAEIHTPRCLMVPSGTPLVRTLSDIKESSNELLEQRKRNEYRALIEKKQE